MADAIVERLADFTPALLADTAWAFGELQFYDYDLLAHLGPYLRDNAARFGECFFAGKHF